MLCVQKGSQLPQEHKDQKYQEHKDQKYKGRLVFQGNNVKDELKDWAVFNELGSNAAPLEGAKLIDMFGLQPGHTIQTADADQAYIQAAIKECTLEKEKGTDGKRKRVHCQTWITLPEEFVI